MAENLAITEGTKEEQYLHLLPQIEALMSHETDLIANLANVCAALKEQFNWFWVGFYLVKKEELIVGPFQGPIACTRIKKGKGVCGTSWARGVTLIVEDVNQFPGHIACNGLSCSEIVVPVFQDGMVVAVLDVDSEQYGAFDEIDKQYLEQTVHLIPFGPWFLFCRPPGGGVNKQRPG
jgi:GAF domain-containing protein